MAEPILNAASVVAGVCQRIAAAMPQHVGMNGERKPGALADALDQPVHCVWCERAAPLSLKHKAALALPLQRKRSVVPIDLMTTDACDGVSFCG